MISFIPLLVYFTSTSNLLDADVDVNVYIMNLYKYVSFSLCLLKSVLQILNMYVVVLRNLTEQRHLTDPGN